MERGVSEYIALLNRTSHLAVYNTTHHVLRGLYNVYGKSVVDVELDRQFSTTREDVFAQE